jgi:flagellum-specific peptidoglycan hydrolase FlgJ
MNRNKKADNYGFIAGTEYAPYAAWIIAQAKHESANFTSRVYRTDNNPFGLKYYSDSVSMGTKGLAASDGGNYTHFKNDQIAFKAYLNWIRRETHAGRKTGPLPTNYTTVDQFAQGLRDRGYYTDSVSNYTAALKRWLN